MPEYRCPVASRDDNIEELLKRLTRDGNRIVSIANHDLEWVVVAEPTTTETRAS